jgi:hypothetical protein
MTDLNKIQAATATIITDGVSLEPAIQSSSTTGSEVALVVREAQKGQGTMTTSIPVVIASDQSTLTVSGNKTNNNAAPGATNIGALVALANAAAPSWTEGNEVLLSTDLSGNLRVSATGTSAVNISQVGGASITLGQKTMANSFPVVIASDQSTLTTAGNLTNNNAAPAATNVGVLNARANAAAPTWTEGNQVLLSTDLSGNLRVTMAAATSTVVGNLTNNNAAPSTNHIGALTARANAAAPTWTEGNEVLLSTDLSGTLRVSTTGTNQVVGNVASGAADSGNPVKIGAVGHTAQPTAVTDGQRVDIVGDKVGRLVVTNMQVRDLKTNSRTSFASTTETTVLAAVVSTFLDLTQIIITNTHVTKDANVDFRDSTGGTIRVTIHAPALATVVVNFADILTQATVNNNWTAQSDTATPTLAITVLAIKNI